VVRALKASPNPDGIVDGPDQMTRVRVAADLPTAERPSLQVLNTASATFHTIVEQARQARGADFSVCDIEIPSRETPAA